MRNNKGFIIQDCIFALLVFILVILPVYTTLVNVYIKIETYQKNQLKEVYQWQKEMLLP